MKEASGRIAGDDPQDVRIDFSELAATGTQFYRSFINALPPEIKDDPVDPDDGITTLTIQDRRALQSTLIALGTALNREIRWMKKTYRDWQIKRGVDSSKKNYLCMRIEELEETAPESDEMASLLDQLSTIEHSELCSASLRMLIDSYSDYLGDIRKLENIGTSIGHVADAAREVEGILSDLVQTLQKTKDVARISSSMLQPDS